MRGLRLFVRPIETADAPALAEFLAAEGVPAAPPACGLLAKMLGRIVAVAGFEIAADGLRLESLLVSSELRRRRIGGFMVREVSDFARKMEREEIYVPRAAGTALGDAFLQKAGFDGREDRWVLRAG